MLYYYKEKTSKSLNDLLLGAPYFKQNWKLIPRVIKVLNQINRWSQIEASPSITRTFFFNRLGNEYASIMSEIESIDLLTIDRTSRKRHANGEHDMGKCYSYALTDKCCVALADTNTVYLYQLLTDKTAKRLNQKRISARGYHKNTYGDVRDELKRTIDGIRFDHSKIEAVAAAYTPAKRAFVYSLLIDVVKKDYSPLKHNKKDNRIWNPYTQLPAEIKSQISIDGLQYIATVDVRSCYPSLVASHIQRLFPDDTSIISEVKKWKDLFLNPEKEPKQFLADLLNATKEQVKDVMISYFNGKGFKQGAFDGKGIAKAFNEWLSVEFPNLYTLWLTTDIKQTGNGIGKHFETKLMLDQRIYNKARGLGLVIGYEYDGFSIYGHDASRVPEMIAFIESLSSELLGLQLVFVDKTDTLSLADMAKEQHERSISAIHDQWVKVCRKTFAKGKLPDWISFREAREDYKQGVASHLEAMKAL